MILANQTNISFSDKELLQLADGIKAITAVLSGKISNLTPEQRGQYNRITTQNKSTTDNVSNYIKEHPDRVSRFWDQEEFDRDVTIRQEIDAHIPLLKNLSQQLVDTKTLLDYNHYATVLIFYQMMRELAGKNQFGAKTIYQDIKVFFEQNDTTKQ